MEVPEIKHSVLTHGHVLGTIDLRGRIVPIVDFRGFVGKQKTDSRQVAASSSNKLLIMNLLEGQIGLLVYSIDSIIPYYAQDVLPISKLAMPHEAIFRGCLAVENTDLVMLFDHEETMKQPDLVAAAQCCQELYPDGTEEEEARTAASKTRRTFITFRADSDFAMDITEVREVIDCPDDLMKPPNRPKSVAGLFNLREEIITLIDLRVLYGMNSARCRTTEGGYFPMRRPKIRYSGRRCKRDHHDHSGSGFALSGGNLPWGHSGGSSRCERNGSGRSRKGSVQIYDGSGCCSLSPSHDLALTRETAFRRVRCMSPVSPCPIKQGRIPREIGANLKAEP